MKIYQWRMLQFIAAIGWLLAAIFGLAVFLGGVIEPIDSFLEYHDTLFLSIGVLVFVSLLALYTGHLTNQSAERRERFSQKMQALIKISEFRQTWIDRVRDDLSDLQLGLFKYRNGEPEGLNDILTAMQRLRLSLNHQEVNSIKLESAISKATKLIGKQTKVEINTNISKINKAGSKILKDEWERLKKDLEEAQSIKEALE